MGFLRSLFSSGDFMPHGMCYLWRPGVVLLHVVSDSLIALAYFSIPITLVYFIRKRKDLPFDGIFVCFGLFILACGTTHAMEVWTLWHATYWLSGGIKAITALVSVPTAILLVRSVPEALALPSPEALRQEIAARKSAEADLRVAGNELELRVEQRTAELRESNKDLLLEIVQRIQTEEQLRRSEERFRLLVESVKDYAICGLDPAGKVVSWNSGAEHIEGYRAAEVTGRHFSLFYVQEDLELGKPQMELQVAAAAGRLEEDAWRVRKDGSRFWANVVITAMRDQQGKLVGFSKITRDLTERKRADEALRESEEQLRLAQNASGSGMWDWNPHTDVATWSSQHSRIFGLDPSDSNRTGDSFFNRILPEDREPVEVAVLEALKPGGELEIEFRIKRPDGEVRWVISKGRTHCDANLEPIRMIGLTQDITERKQLEQALLQTQTELAHLSRVLTIGELTSSIAHEVNQPLAAVVANGDACRRWLSAEPPDVAKARECATWIVSEGNRASDVVQRIRALSKKTLPEKSRLEINQVVREVIGLLGTELARNHVSLETELASDLPVVVGDRVQLQQVVLNLITNAIDAMNSITGPRELRLSTKATGENELLISVRDCGTGLAPGLSGQVFQPFFTTKPTGMGLGLSICRRIIEGHGGRLWATPNPLHGVTFQFTLPRVAGASA